MIGRTKASPFNAFSSCFNSTMGWLEEPSYNDSQNGSDVSIPLWDDWKVRKELEGVERIWEFQFHYGMIGSDMNAPLLLPSIVSIPLWDDWKKVKKVGAYIKITVSIPLWDDWKYWRGCPLPNSSAVSIPLWDDWKRELKYSHLIRIKFQFHYGMIGSIGKRIWEEILLSFNSTMGWLEAKRFWIT